MSYVGAEFDPRHDKLEWRRTRSSSVICKIKFRSKSVVVAPTGSSDDQVSSSDQQKWSAQERVYKVLRRKRELGENISEGSFFIVRA